jgi:hypothetical protein
VGSPLWEPLVGSPLCGAPCGEPLVGAPLLEPIVGEPFVRPHIEHKNAQCENYYEQFIVLMSMSQPNSTIYPIKDLT